MLLVPLAIAAAIGGTVALYIVIAVTTIALLGLAGGYAISSGPMHGFIHQAMPPEYYDDLAGRSDRDGHDDRNQR
ncbi:MAG: hypothetical protein U5Q44_08205 [Dehalococcoidia bacterium]|nr:hypothetical protein [Dehalococcoidia bacterium]